MEFLYLIFFTCLKLLFLDVEINPDPQRPVPAAIMFGALSGTLLTWRWLCLSMIYCRALILWSQIRELQVPGFGRPVLLYWGKMPRPEGWLHMHVRDGYGAFCQNKFECDCCGMLFFMVCGVRQNIHVFSLYHNPDVDDRILLFTSINDCCAGCVFIA